jgi:hypothetical protein
MATGSSLRLDLSRTFHGVSGNQLKVSANEKLHVAARVTGINVPKGSLLLIWDGIYAKLLEGSAWSELPSGTYEHDFEWVFQTHSVVGMITFKVEIEARAGSLIQKALLPVEIHGKK